MEYSANIRSINDVEFILNWPVSELIIQVEGFSRFGGLKPYVLPEVVSKIRKSGKKPVFAWDSLLKDDLMKNLTKESKHIIELTDSVRFLDPGLGVYLKQLDSGISLQLTLEHGSLNSESIKNWVSVFSDNLEKVVLSNQLPLTDIRRFANLQGNVSIEILGYGDIEMFYSKRQLINRHLASPDVERLLTIASDDRPSQVSKVIDSSAGTIVFYDKPLNLLGMLKEVEDAGIDCLRIENYDSGTIKALSKVFEKENWSERLGKEDKVSITGFAGANESHELFSNLSNIHIKSKIDAKIGVILEAVKNSYLLLKFDQETTLPKNIQFISPEGKTVHREISVLTDLSGKIHQNEVRPGVYTMPWIKLVVAGSILIENQKAE